LKQINLLYWLFNLTHISVTIVRPKLFKFMYMLVLYCLYCEIVIYLMINFNGWRHPLKNCTLHSQRFEWWIRLYSCRVEGITTILLGVVVLSHWVGSVVSFIRLVDYLALMCSKQIIWDHRLSEWQPILYVVNYQ